MFVLLPPARDRLLCFAQEKFGYGRFTLLQHAIAAFGVDVVLKRNLWITRVELEGVLLLLHQARIVTVERPVTRIHRQLLLAHAFGHVDSMSDALTVSNNQ